MNANVVAAFSCSYSVVPEETCLRLAEPGRTTATRHRRQVAAATATMLSLIFSASSSSSNLRNAPPHLQNRVRGMDSLYLTTLPGSPEPDVCRCLLFWCCPFYLIYRTGPSMYNRDSFGFIHSDKSPIPSPTVRLFRDFVSVHYGPAEVAKSFHLYRLVHYVLSLLSDF